MCGARDQSHHRCSYLVTVYPFCSSLSEEQAVCFLSPSDKPVEHFRVDNQSGIEDQAWLHITVGVTTWENEARGLFELRGLSHPGQCTTNYNPVSTNNHQTNGQMNQELMGKMKVVHHGHEKYELSVSTHF